MYLIIKDQISTQALSIDFHLYQSFWHQTLDLYYIHVSTQPSKRHFYYLAVLYGVMD